MMQSPPRSSKDQNTHKHKRAEYYYENDMISREVRDLACEVARTSGQSIDHVLIAYRFISEYDQLIAESTEKGIPHADLNTTIPSAEALQSIPKEMALKRGVLPITIDEKSLTIAVDTDHDLRSLGTIERTTLREIQWVYVQKSQLIDALQHYYQHQYVSQKENLYAMIQDHDAIEVIGLVDALIHIAIDTDASDIHLAPEEDVVHVFLRLDGVLQHYCSLPIEIRDQIVSRIKIMCQLDISQKRVAQDGSMTISYEEKDFDMRISTMPTDMGESVVIRILTNTHELFQLEQLGLSDDILTRLKRLAKKPHGVILLSGPTGSGKTTTLYAILREVNRLQKNILTIENPIEYRIPFVNQTQYNPKAGYTYDKAIRAFMRQDPDIILVGEIRDTDTAQIAMEASITGHLVLSTVHTNDAVGALVRLRGLQVPSFLLSEGMLAVIAQRLIRKLCPFCKHPRRYTKEELSHFNIGAQQLTQDTYDLYDANGCDKCNHTGYYGRQAITELFEVDSTIKMMIFEEVSTVEITNYILEQGMMSLQENLFAKIVAGITTLEEYERTIL